jgi:hypothetical protein
VSNAANVPPNSTIHGSATCPAGKRVLGGGVSITYEQGNNFSEQSQAHLLYSFPIDDATWSAGVINHNDHDLQFTWWAVCATTS